MVEQNIESIRKPILLPLALVLVALLSVSLYGMHYVQEQNSSQQAYESLTQAQQLFRELLQNEAGQIVFFLDPLETEGGPMGQFVEERREDLYQSLVPLFNQARAEQDISHLYFIKPDGQIFLRVHEPERFDDQAKHAAFIRSRKLLKQSVGIEVGEYGRLTLNVVYPWYREGVLLGFLEAGKDLTGLTPKLKRLLGAELLFSINKKYIDRKDWEASVQERGKKSSWEALPQCVVVDQTLEIIPKELCNFLQQTDPPAKAKLMEISYSGREYRGGLVPLIDAGGTFIGTMAVLKDISNREVSIWAMAIYTGFSGLAIMFCIYFIFFWHVNRIDRRLLERRENLHEEAQSALAESERLYRAITSTVLEAIIMIDEEELITYWNPAAGKIFDYSVDEVIGSSILTLIVSPQSRVLFRQGLSLVKNCGTEAGTSGKIIELTVKRKGGEIIPVELSLAAIEIAGQCCAIAVIRDISERRRALSEWEGLQAQLRQSQKMEAIGTLAGGIAHDFNNILGAIMGYTELALMELSDGEPLRDHLEQVRNASRRAKDLVAHILAFSRQSELTKKPLDVSPIIKEALKMLRASLPTTIEIRQNIASGLGRIMADPTQIHQVLMNLSTNAAHAMGERGGILEVGLSRVFLQDEFILKGYHLSHGEYLCLSVRDTGLGMEEVVLNRIFDPFFTTKKRGVGTGMGLSVVHGIVSSHGGGIRVRSVPGEGSTFELFFPLIETQPEELQKAVFESPPTGKERVLLVDDEPSLIELGQKALSYLGYDVVTRTCGVEALELFQSTPEKFDLVITDYTMPHMTGMDLARKLLEIRPDIPIILCTGFSENISEEKAKAQGIRGYVMKPVSIHNLANTCRRVLDSTT